MLTIQKKIYHRLQQLMFMRKHRHLQTDYEMLYLNSVSGRMETNTINVAQGTVLSNCQISFNGKNCTLKIGKGCTINKTSFWFEDGGGCIEIGDHTTMEEGCQFASVGGRTIKIGNDCMFSHKVDVRTTDSHSILDADGKRINPDEDVVIGNHVWLGIRTTILKGSRIADNSIVAACALVSLKKEVSEGSILAGVPAKVVKENINWNRKRI